jgi:DNA-binding LytR/AlgR family response regulator
MRIGLCEDIHAHQVILLSHIETFKTKYDITTSTYESGEELIAVYESGERFDLLFLDIHMSKITGYETAKIVRLLDASVKIIFTTSIVEYAVDGYDIGVDGFLFKPISADKFEKVFKRILKTIKSKKPSIYTYTNKECTVSLKIDDIHYIESNNRKITIHTKDDEYEQYRSIKDAEIEFLIYGFVRTHR